MGTRCDATISTPARASCSASVSRPASVSANTSLTMCVAGWAMASSSPSATWSVKPASAAVTASAVRPVTASAGGDGPDDSGPLVAAGDAVEHRQCAVGVAGEHQDGGLVGHQLLCQA